MSQKINLGIPEINNFPPIEYQASTQNWQLKIANHGNIYVANNDGLLTFDGNSWSTHPLPNKTIARSLDILQDTILVGGQDELGYFLNKENGNYRYYDLFDKIPAQYQNIADIWDVAFAGNGFYFRNSFSIFQLDGEKFTVISEETEPSFLKKIGENLYFNEYKNNTHSLFTYTRGKKELLTSMAEDIIVIDFIAANGDYIILTESHGIFTLDENKSLRRWSKTSLDYLLKNQITSATLLENNTIAVGTRLGGILILNEEGLPLYKLDKSTGLQNNSITNITEDAWSNLWITSYFGIDRINMGISTNSFYPDLELEGAVYDVKIWEDSWWFGTTNGLYTLPYKNYNSPLNSIPPKLVPGTAGQVWSLIKIEDKLFLGHQTGAYEITKQGDLLNIGIDIGTWKFTKMDNNLIAVGTYDGVRLIEEIGNKWKVVNPQETFQESSRIMVKGDTNEIWISHPYRGIYRMNYVNKNKMSVTKYTEENGLECSQNNYIFRIFGKILVSNACGIFEYNNSKDKFVHSEYLESHFPDNVRVVRLYEKENKIWFISESETGYLSPEALNSYNNEKTLFPHIGKSYVGGFENLFPMDTTLMVYLTNRGIKFFNKKSINKNAQLETIISSIHLEKQDSTILLKENSSLLFQPIENDIEFYFRNNGTIPSDIKEHHYRLVGLDSVWYRTKQSYKNFTNLPAGEYSFQVKSTTKTGLNSEISTIDFRIKEVWYKSRVALVSYFLLLFIGIGMLLLLPRKKYQKNTEKLKVKTREAEEQMELIKQKKLQDEIKYKNSELASVTLHLLQKNQTIQSIRKEVEKLSKNSKDSKTKNELTKLLSTLNNDKRIEEDWDNFSRRFDQVHTNFIQNVKEKYSMLTPNDLKLCAFLKMGLTTKEIAPLLNISVRGVEISRYRLRKKMGIDKELNLNAFMNSI